MNPISSTRTIKKSHVIFCWFSWSFLVNSLPYFKALFHWLNTIDKFSNNSQGHGKVRTFPKVEISSTLVSLIDRGINDCFSTGSWDHCIGKRVSHSIMHKSFPKVYPYFWNWITAQWRMSNRQPSASLYSTLTVACMTCIGEVAVPRSCGLFFFPKTWEASKTAGIEHATAFPDQ